MRNPTIKRTTLAAFFMVLALATVMAAPDAWAHVRRHRHVQRAVVRVAPLRVVVHPGRAAVRVVRVAGRPAGSIDFNVKPGDAAILVNGIYRGTVEQFDGVPRTLTLPAGIHRVTIRTPEGAAWSGKVRVVAGRQTEIDTDLED